MAKNNALINTYRDLQQRNKELIHEIEQTTPKVYAGVALALHREYGWGFKRINRVFQRSQIIWNVCDENEVDMIPLCLEETGIDLRSRTEADNETIIRRE